ncbi:hypothetical protein [Aquimarina agarilytica]|uniref:hypothetical protein n=1 Tax=Aquimarina agarilytica TaxID=1087449 RepID=UPI0002895C2C|nr:hypothetical protein [Aquimarina agarilytica]
MNNKKDIGKIFKERLSDFERSSENITWDHIEIKLNKRKKNKPTYFSKLVGLSIIVLLLSGIVIVQRNTILTGTFLKTNSFEDKTTNDSCYDSSSEVKEALKNASNKQNKQVKIVSASSNKIILQDSIQKDKKNKLANTTANLVNTRIKKTTNHNPIGTKTRYSSPYTKKGSKHINSSSLKPKSIAEKVNKNQKNNLNGIITNTTKKIIEKTGIVSTPTDKKNSLSGAITAFNTPNEENLNPKKVLIKKDSIPKKTKKDTLLYLKPIQNEKVQKLNLTIHTIPLYNIPLSGSLINDKFSENSKSGKLTLNYGLVFSSLISKKNSIRLGYNRLKINTKVHGIESDIVNTGTLPSSGIFLPTIVKQDIGNQQTFSITQKLDYHEFSAEIGHQILKKWFNLSLIGGANFLILQKSDIAIHSGSQDFELNRNTSNTNNKGLKQFTYGITIGSSFTYKLLDNVSLSVEPLFKYHLNNASKNTDSYKPLYFSTQIGLSIDL